MRFKLVSVPLIDSPFSTQKVLVIGGGCGGCMTALRLRQLGFSSVTLMSKSLFGIDDCTIKVTQLHLSGLEYVNHRESAKALIVGGLEFLRVFGVDSINRLQQLGVLDHEGTLFRFNEATLRQHTPDPDTVLNCISELEDYYQEVKQSAYSEMNLPSRLFPSVTRADESRYAAVEVGTIQPGIAIMRLGALLKSLMEANGIDVVSKTVDGQSISIENDRFKVGDTYFDVIINSTNGSYLSINSVLEKRYPTQFQADPTPMVKNNRFQLYIEIKETDFRRQFYRTIYTLCTSNHGDQGIKQFFGTMLDHTGFDPFRKSAGLVLYAAGPQDPAASGGGSWGKTGVSLNEPDDWKALSETQLSQIQSQILRSVGGQFPDLNRTSTTSLLLHNGYNMNVASMHGRSDARPFVDPQINCKKPFFATIFCLKFTHSAYSSKRSVDLLLATGLTLGQLDVTQHARLLEINRRFELNIDGFTSEKLTELARRFCVDAGVTPRLTEYLSAPKI